MAERDDLAAREPSDPSDPSDPRDPRDPPADADGSPEPPLTPEQARATLRAAAQARVVSERDRRLLVGFVGGLGVVIALILALSWWTLSQDNTPGFVVSMSGYAVAIVLLVLAQKRANSAPRGFARLYRVGFTLSMVLYAVGVAWFAPARPPVAAAVFLPYCVLVALPLLVTAWRIDRLARA